MKHCFILFLLFLTLLFNVLFYLFIYFFFFFFLVPKIEEVWLDDVRMVPDGNSDDLLSFPIVSGPSC